ncbi:secretin and TonB N-terminal domain-containing protein [Hydrogenophaga sp.]|uniref:secretin and TonB N-terminal domain-containing protein n=1 Tax=Hydrogenophaga sp. TaxID=1904254 RepID=UPI002AC9DD15|nr:secretin and TonB N-terminal domain-containing protein [Hydrogenophaga sp.]
MPIPRALSLLIVSVLLSACAPLQKPLPGSEGIPPTAYGPVNQKLKEAQATLPPAAVSLPAEQRLPTFDVNADKGSGQPALYSFKARDLPLRDALGLLARAHGLNIVADPDIAGTVTVDFQDVPLSQAFDILLSSMGYSWDEEQGIIRVRASITRTFEIDYIRSGRSPSSAGGAGADAGAFWGEFESQIRSLLSPKGRLTVNRLTGAVMLTDLPSKVAEASRFIDLMRDGMYRQIDIEVRIVEVTLRDQFALGLDWSRFSINPLRGVLGVNTLINAPQATTRLPGTITANFSGDRYGALIEALREQGDVRMVSQPRIRILNNQTAAVKVGTDETFFSRSTNRIIQGGGNVLDTVNEQARSVNLGVTLTVTPQISADGWAMLNIAPTVTRLVGVVSSPSGESSAPVLDVSEATTMVRVRSGELVMLGGLIQEETSDTNRRVPGLGDLPVIGNAFKSTYQAGKRKELVIFLAPTVQPGQ